MTLHLPDGSPVYEPTNTPRLGNTAGKLGGLAGVIILYIIGNIVLVGAQKIWHSGNQSKLDNIKQELTAKKVVIDDLESKLHSKKLEMDRNSANGYIDAYNLEVDNYNAMLSKYKNDIDNYNKHVDEANDLSKRIGGTWYIVPIPVGGIK